MVNKTSTKSYGLALMVFMCLISGQARAEFELSPVFAQMPWTTSVFVNPETPQARQALLTMMSTPQIAQLPWLAPAQGKIRVADQEPALQDWIDRSMEKIFQTPTARQICQQSTGGQTSLIQEIYGVSSASARHLSGPCTPTRAWEIVEKQRTPRRYLMIYANEPTSLDGWTNSKNVTYLFFHPQTTDQEALRTLIHEMATELDQKNMLGWMGLDNVGRTHYDFKNPKFPACQISQFLANPYLRYAFSATRAHALEDQVLREMGFTVPTQTGLCGRVELNSLPALFKVNAIFSTETLLNNTLNQINQQSCQDLQLDEPSNLLLNWNQLLNRTRVQGPDGTDTDLCRFLEIPSWGTLHFTPFEGGPRPRVGEGWLKTQEMANPGLDLSPARQIKIQLPTRDQSLRPDQRMRVEKQMDERMHQLSVRMEQGAQQ